jgi:hypothetical protein
MVPRKQLVAEKIARKQSLQKGSNQDNSMISESDE